MGHRIKFVLSLFSLALLTGLFVPSLYADTIVNNINGAICPDPAACGLGIAGTDTGNLGQAVAFTPSANYTITSASALLINTFEDTTVNFFIYSSSGGFPGASLGEVGSAPMSGDGGGVFTVNATTPISVLAGTQYWLVLTGGDDDTKVLWEQDALVSAPYAYTADGSDPQDWLTTPIPSVNAQFSVDGTPTVTTTPAATPEPASASLLLTAFGLAGLMYSKRTAWLR